MALVLSVTQRVFLSIKPVDIKGNPAPVDGIPVWTVSDPALVGLAVSDDGMGAIAEAVGVPGHAQISVTADARMGPDVREITGILEIDIVPAEAVALGIVAGEPEEI